MWTNSTRKILISAVYELLFWQKMEEQKEFDLDWDQLIVEYTNQNEMLTKTQLKKVYSSFQKSPDTYLSTIQEYIIQWSKTFDLVKASLVVLLLEKENTDFKNPKSIVSKYIRITQDLVGGENPGLVHAVASKLISK